MKIFDFFEYKYLVLKKWFNAAIGQIEAFQMLERKLVQKSL